GVEGGVDAGVAGGLAVGIGRVTRGVSLTCIRTAGFSGRRSFRRRVLLALLLRLPGVLRQRVTEEAPGHGQREDFLELLQGCSSCHQLQVSAIGQLPRRNIPWRVILTATPRFARS